MSFIPPFHFCFVKIVAYFQQVLEVSIQTQVKRNILNFPLSSNLAVYHIELTKQVLFSIFSVDVCLWESMNNLIFIISDYLLPSPHPIGNFDTILSIRIDSYKTATTINNCFILWHLFMPIIAFHQSLFRFPCALKIKRGEMLCWLSVLKNEWQKIFLNLEKVNN